MPQLDPKRTESRYHQVDERTDCSLELLYTGPSHGFTEWLTHGTGLYWIRGLPGSGKSTAMKYIFDDVRTSEALSESGHEGDWVAIGTFFLARGAEIQKTLEGMLRSILLQLLSKTTGFAMHLMFDIVMHHVPKPFTHPSTDVQRNGSSDRSPYAWSQQSLQHALKAVLSHPQMRLSILLLVDAPDEHSGDHRSVATFLRTLAHYSEYPCVRCKVLVPSRDEIAFREVFCDDLFLDIHERTREDMRLLVDAKILRHPVMHGFYTQLFRKWYSKPRDKRRRLSSRHQASESGFDLSLKTC